MINFASTWNNLLKYCISAEFLLVAGYVQCALRKELRIDPFVERFKADTLGKSYWWKLSLTGKIYLSIAFFSDFLLILSYTQGALQKELLITSFAELFQNANLGRCYW